MWGELDVETDRAVRVRKVERLLHEARGRLELLHLRAARILGLAHLLPPPARVRVVLVDALNVGRKRRGSVRKTDFHELGHDVVARLGVVSEEHRDRPAFANDPGIDRLVRAGDWEPLATEPMQELEGAVDRLRDAVEIEQAEPAMEGDRGEVVLLEDVREGPEAVAVHEGVGLQHDLGGVSRGERLVVIRVPRIRGDVPFRKVDGPFARVLPHEFRPIAHEIARAVGELLLRVGALEAEWVGRVEVRADEVHRKAVPLAVVEQLVDPRGHGRRRATDAERRVDGLNGLSSMAVELEVVALRPRPERREVGFVPDFEEPLAHLGDAVALDPVDDQLADEHRPGVVVLGWGDIPPVVENGLVTRGQHLGHEAQLNEGSHPDRQQEIPDAVRIEEGVERLLLVTDQRAHIVREESVEANMSEAELLVAAAELLLPI